MMAGTGLILGSCMQGTGTTGFEHGKLSVSDAKPHPGDSLSVTLNSGEEASHLVMSYYNGEKTLMSEVATSRENGITTARVVVPETAHSLAFDFTANSYRSLNDAVILPVYDREGTPRAESTIGQAKYQLGPGNRFGHETDTSAVIALYKKALKANPSSNLRYDYATVIQRADKDKGGQMLTDLASEIEGQISFTADDLELLSQIYYALKEFDKQDSIRKVLVSDYPDASWALRQKGLEILQGEDFEKKATALNKFLEDHPDHYNNEYLAGELAKDYASRENFDQYYATAAKIDNRPGRARIQRSVVLQLLEKGELERAEKMAREILEMMEEEMKNPVWDQSRSTRSEYLRSQEYYLKRYNDLYAGVLYKKGDLDQAISYQEKAAGTTSSGSFNEKYVQYLIEAEQYKKAQEAASSYVAHNASSPQLREYLETAFEKNNNEGSFDDLMADLNLQAREKMKEELLEDMIHEKAPEFKLKNIEGGEISLSELKGKTVILDFWATWCGPCKASFPGMQLAVEKYSSEEDVVFLFIDTFENGGDEKRIKSTGGFIRKNNYDFTVLLDTYHEEDRSYEAAQAYKVRGIPAKFIIGPDGYIKFSTLGGSSSLDKMVTEIDLMIELARS